ncbi:MAG: cupredoxin domain-containing protein [Gammaproteobacteria bacterium]|nr:cupredoxin domain-containing protein [Gammaproteobacteria bacterium]
MAAKFAKARALAAALMLATGAAAADAGQDVVERELVIRDGRFQPELIEVPAGRRIRLVVRNEGPGPEEFEIPDLRKEVVLNQGTTRRAVLAPLRPGEYPFLGEFHPDTARGRLVAR